MEIVSVGDRGKKAFACRRAHTGTNTNESMYILQSTRLLSQDLPEINSMDVALPADDYDSDPATSGHGVGILNGEKLGDPTWFCTQLERAPGELERHLQDALMGKPMHNVMLLQTRLPRSNPHFARDAPVDESVVLTALCWATAAKSHPKRNAISAHAAANVLQMECDDRFL
eukprot:scaffold87818_cov36-Tisochrysis_lutea.AAC.2